MTPRAKLIVGLCLFALMINLISCTSVSTNANYDLAEKWTPIKIHNLAYSTSTAPNWLPDSDKFWYGYRTSDGRQYWLVDPEQKSKTPLFGRDKLASKLEEVAQENVDGSQLRLPNLTVSTDPLTLHFEMRDFSLSYDPAANALTVNGPVESPSSPPGWANISPDGELCLFAREHNLFLLRTDDPDSTEIQLTFAGESENCWGMSDEIILNGNTDRRRIEVLWSPDSRHFGVLRADNRQVNELWLVDHLVQPRPTLKTFKYAMPGENVPQWEVWLFDRDNTKMNQIDITRWPDQMVDELFHTSAWWSEDSATLYFVRRSRDFKKVDLCAIDPSSGENRVVLEERMDGQVYIEPLIQLPETDELMWWSMRDGQGHYYLYSENGELKNQITSGDYFVSDVLSVDTDSRVLYFLANGREEGRNPYYKHMYRVNFDGSGLTLLSPEDAAHNCYMSPTNKYFLDDYSRQDLPNHIVVRDNNGQLINELEEADITQLMDAGWQLPEVFSAKSADGVTDMWGVMHKPLDFDPSKSYPIVTRGYPGRQDEGVTEVFWPTSTETYLANLGCVVVQFGNRGGTPERGVAYREYNKEAFRDYALPDKKAVIEELAAKHNWIDLDRVGIYGSSSGGFMTTSALLVYPEFFKVGVAITGPSDPSQYSNIWAERYYGVTKTENEDGSISWASKPDGNIELADKLQGKLLLVYGSQDDNVHPVHMYRMADALVKANKKFDMFVIPGVDHSMANWQYMYQLVWDYFAEHLIEEK